MGTLLIRSDNFQFLAAHDEQLVRHAALAERYFADDPATSLIKLRQFCELMAQQVAARTARLQDPREPMPTCCGVYPPIARFRGTWRICSTNCA